MRAAGRADPGDAGGDGVQNEHIAEAREIFRPVDRLRPVDADGLQNAQTRPHGAALRGKLRRGREPVAAELQDIRLQATDVFDRFLLGLRDDQQHALSASLERGKDFGAGRLGHLSGQICAGRDGNADGLRARLHALQSLLDGLNRIYLDHVSNLQSISFCPNFTARKCGCQAAKTGFRKFPRY